MGFFFSDPKDHIKHSELKKELKSMRTRGELTSQQHDELLHHFEEHKRDSYSREHMHKVFRHAKSVTGDSLSSDKISRIEKKFAEKIESRIAPTKEAYEPKTTEASKPEKITNLREYKGLNPESLESPHQEHVASEPRESQESLNDRFNKAA